MTLSKLRKERLKLKIQDARMQLVKAHPFFGILLMYLKYIAIDNIKTISTNGRCIYFHPDFIDKLNPYELEFILCHQIMHIVRGDIWRDEAYKGDDYHRAFNIIANNELRKRGWNIRLLTHLGRVQCEVDSSWRLTDDTEMLDVYNRLPFKLNKLDEHTYRRYVMDSDYWWDYKDDDGKDGILILDVPHITAFVSKPGSGKGGEETEAVGYGDQMKAFWETKTEQAQKTAELQGKEAGAGNDPGRLRRKMTKDNTSVLDWRKLLDSFVEEETTDYSFSPPDRRFSDLDFYLPDFNEKEFVPKEILFMADTSGSIDQNDLGTVFAELRGAIEQHSGKIYGKLGFFDAEIIPPIPFTDMDSLNRIAPYGGGGTNFTIIFDYVRTKMRHCLPAAIVVFTDGEGEFPPEESTMGIPVLWLINNNYVDPPFGKVARVIHNHRNWED